MIELIPERPGSLSGAGFDALLGEDTRPRFVKALRAWPASGGGDSGIWFALRDPE